MRCSTHFITILESTPRSFLERHRGNGRLRVFHETGETNSTHLRVGSGTSTPWQLLFGHEPAPIEGEAFDDEQQSRSITASMAERPARQQSAMKAWLQAEAESRVEQAQNRRTRVVQHWPSGTRVCCWRADVPSMGSLPTIRQGSTPILNKHKGAWLGPATVLAQEMGRSQEQHEEAHGTVSIVVQGLLMRCAPGHLRHLSERESLSIDRHPILVPSYLQELNVANARVGAERNT